MDLRRVATLLPCAGLSDFPTELPENDAARVLHHWTAAWHPSLLAASGRLPEVWSAASPPPPPDAQGALILIPLAGVAHGLDDWRARLAAEPAPGAVIVESIDRRQEIIAELRRRGLAVSRHAERWAPEFYALGYAYVQVEQFAHGLSGGAIVDPAELERRVVAAARAAVDGEDTLADDALRGAYDLLEQVRDHEFAVRNHVLDLVLLGDTTLGTRLDRELEDASPKSYVAPSSVIRELLAAPEPLRGRLAECCVVATNEPDRQLAVLSPAELGEHVEQAIELARQLAPGAEPSFALTQGATPPRIVTAATGAHATGLLLLPLDGSPELPVRQRRFSWAAPSGELLECLTGEANDGASAAALLCVGCRLRDSLYGEHVAVEVFAAWAGCRHELFHDLRRVAARSTVLGRLVTLDQFWEDTQGVASTDSPLAEQLGNRLHASSAGEARVAVLANLDGLSQYAAELARLPRDAPSAGGVAAAAGRLAAAVDATSGPAATAPGAARLVANAWSYPRTVLAGDPGADGWCDLLAAEIVPEVPGLGYRVIDAGPRRSVGDTGFTRATPLLVQSESLQVTLDEATGGVRSIRTPSRRRNRVSQRIAVRRGARLIELPIRTEITGGGVLANAADRGASSVEGRLYDLKGGLIANFTQRVTLLAHCDRVFIDLWLDSAGADTKLDELRFACRLALPDADWLLERGVQWSRLLASGRSLHASDYVHASHDDGSVTLCARGANHLVWHSARMLDALLPHEAGGRSHARLAIAIDEPRPLRAALDLAAQAAPAALAPCAAAPGSAGWLVHQDLGNVQVGRVWMSGPAALRIELVETEGRRVEARLRFAAPPREAYWVQPWGVRGGQADRVGDAVATRLCALESRVIEVTW